MPKFVYLFELDSVRKTDKEIEIGQKTLYNEIVCNGNVVVLTYNQLVDSRGFFSLLSIPEYYNNILTLFNNGSIRISQYGDIRTIAQYLMNSFDYDKEFIYSGWPLKSTQKRLLALIKRCLMYSDLSEINSYITENRSEEEVRDLFTEVVNNVVQETSLTIEQCKEILKKLYWLLKTVLRLSAMHSIYIPPRDVNEYKDLKFHNILNFVVNFKRDVDTELWDSAINLIKGLQCFGRDDRSVYIREIKSAFDKGGCGNKKVFQYAEMIINLVYNYTCEISICNISKHYNVDELASAYTDKSTFQSDFFSRINQDWNLGDWDNRFLLDESNGFEEFKNIDFLPDFAEAVRIAEYGKNENAVTYNCVYRYEYEISGQRKNQKKCIMKSIGKKIIFSIVCILIACMIEFIFQFLQNTVDELIDLNSSIRNILETLIFLFVTEGITTFLSKRFSGLLSLSEALGGIGQLVKDAFHILFRRVRTYMNECKKNIDSTEYCSKVRPINYIKSDAIRKYLKIRNNTIYSSAFEESNIYPIADIEDTNVLGTISRLEELYDYHFGVVYKSKYNIMCVDPIVDNHENYFPYERIIPTAGTGVVMVTMHKENFILLKQYRHAPRKIQMSFPRGYGELGIFSEANAEKELKEEINAHISKTPVFLGEISPDSGLTSCCVDVYLVEVDSYSQNDGYEGIMEIKEISDSEFKNMMNQNEDDYFFDDGFTISAYTLYKRYVRSVICK